MLDVVQPFLEKAKRAGCVRVELRADGVRDEATAIVRSWDLAGEVGGIAGEVVEVGQEDSGNLARGALKYILIAWTDRGPWGRKTLSFGDAQHAYKETFSENDATMQGMVAEAVRDRQFGQRMNYNAMQLVINQLSAMIDRYAVMHAKTEERYLETVTAFEQLITAYEDRQIKRQELKLRQATQERMVETIVPLVKPVANRLLAHVTGSKAVLAPEMFDDIAAFLMNNEQIALKWVMDLPEEQRPGMFELLKIFEARKAEIDKQKAEAEARKQAIAADQDRTLGMAPVQPPHPPIVTNGTTKGIG